MPEDCQLTELDVRLATIKETAKTERQKNLLNLAGTFLNAVIGIGNAFLIIYNTTKVDVTEQKIDATNQQWKAYQTKEPEDVAKAAEALHNAERMK